MPKQQPPAENAARRAGRLLAPPSLSTPPQPAAVAVQEVHEQKGRTALVAVGERVVLHDKVQQMRGLGLHGGVGGLHEHALVQIAQQRVQPIAPVAGEQVRGLTARHQLGLEAVQGGALLVQGGQGAGDPLAGLDGAA